MKNKDEKLLWIKNDDLMFLVNKVKTKVDGIKLELRKKSNSIKTLKKETKIKSEKVLSCLTELNNR